MAGCGCVIRIAKKQSNVPLLRACLSSPRLILVRPDHPWSRTLSSLHRTRTWPSRGQGRWVVRTQDATSRRAQTHVVQSIPRSYPGTLPETVADNGRTCAPLPGTRSSPLAIETKSSRRPAPPDQGQFPAQWSFAGGRPANGDEHRH